MLSPSKCLTGYCLLHITAHLSVLSAEPLCLTFFSIFIIQMPIKEKKMEFVLEYCIIVFQKSIVGCKK